MRYAWAFVLLFVATFALKSQISPGDLSDAHAHLEGVNNCTKCHAAGNKVTNDNCLSCHPSIKASQTNRKGYHASSEVMGKNCYSCHNEHHGRKFRLVNFNKTGFDHRKTGFELQGAHAKQACIACHKSNKKNTWLGLNKNCVTCHNDYHQGKMSSNCLECHNFTSFKESKPFDHSKTRFPLLGKHKALSCKQCHKQVVVNGKTKQNFAGLKYANCNACHQDAHENRFGQDCKKCHTETSFHTLKTNATFDHDKTNFKLLGKHRNLECKQCHTSGDWMKPLKHGLCSDCHKDLIHKGEFAKNGKSPDCSQCHTNDGFDVSTFNVERHQSTAFKLTGSHLATACNSCHYKTGSWHFKNIGSNCVDCHKEEHKGLISSEFYDPSKCTTCHNDSSWNTIEFDHTRTGFTLEGKHAEATCKQCHYRRNKAGQIEQKFAETSPECVSCHRDRHAGQFDVNGQTNCARCHESTHWKVTKFDHSTSRFKLDGAHLNVACSECHKRVNNEKGSYVEYKFESIECSRCHQSL